MNLLTKTFTLVLLYVCTSQSIFAENIAIMESKSFHPMQVMDDNWKAVAESMGHSTSIHNQSDLDDIANFDNADVLILSSGLIDLPANRQATIQQFIESGRSIYIQSEFQLSHPGNVTFENIVSNLGNSFTWEGETSGSITPMQIVGNLSNTPNAANALSYYWYGTYGSGDASIIPFLQNDDKNYGFIYCPEDMNIGKIVTTTDQDWVRINLSTALMGNIVELLASGANNLAPLVSIEMTQDQGCDNSPFIFDANIQNNSAGISLQWTINGLEISGATDATFTSSDLTSGDVVECIISMAMDCAIYEHVSNPILIAPAASFLSPNLNITADATSICQGMEVTFTSIITDSSDVESLFIQWYLNGNPINGANNDIYTNDALGNNDEITCELIYDNLCDQNLLETSNNLTITVTSTLTPSISITADMDEICEGENITFVASGLYWGSNPSFQWMVDGITAGTNAAVFETTNLLNGQLVSCLLSSSENCLLANDIQSNQINTTVNETLTPTLSISANTDEICEGEFVNFIVLGENWGGNPFFQWMIDGQAVGTNDSVFSTMDLGPDQEVSCVVTATGDCLAFSIIEADPVSILVNTPTLPTISIESDLTQICDGTEVTFTANGTSFGSNPTFQWMVDGVNVGTNNNTFSTTDLTNGQMVTCNLTSNAICISATSATSNELSITVNPLSMALLGTTNNFCDNSTGTALVSAIGGAAPFTYQWSNGATTEEITNMTGGLYTVTATDAIGCSATIEVIIEDQEGLAIENIETINADCGGNDGEARIFMSDPTRTYFFTWTNNRGEVVSLNHLAHNLEPGNYNVEITDDNDCFTTETVLIEASTPVLLELDASVRIGFGEEYTLSPKAASAGNLTYSWSPAEGLSCTDCLNPKVTPTQDVKYTLTVTNEAGCSATSSIIIYLNLNHDIYIPNAFSPNGDGQNDFFTAYAGNNVHHIKTLIVVDRWGNVLFNKSDLTAGHETEGWNGTFKGQVVKPGVYVYQIEVQFTDGATETIFGDITIAN